MCGVVIGEVSSHHCQFTPATLSVVHLFAAKAFMGFQKTMIKFKHWGSLNAVNVDRHCGNLLQEEITLIYMQQAKPYPNLVYKAQGKS